MASPSTRRGLPLVVGDFGAHGKLVPESSELERLLRAAFDADAPTLIEAAL